MNKKIIAVLCIIAMFIPTYFAVAYYVSAQNAPVSERTVENMKLTDLEGKEYVFDKKSDEAKKMLAFFIEMNDGAKEVPELPDQLKNDPCYKVVYRSYNKDKLYKYYFTSNPNEAYYVDAQKKVYSITRDSAIEFLSTKYASSSFAASKQPELTVSKMSVLSPFSIDWRYKAGNGDYVSTPYVGSSDASAAYPVSGNLQLEFTNQPDYLTVKILNGEEVIFNDVYENLNSSVIGETNRAYTVEVNAKWYESGDKEYCGEAKYKFTANVSAPAAFYLGEDTIEQGEFVVLTGKNVIDINTLQFTSVPELKVKPKFYKEGDYVVALIPIPLDSEYSPSYVFTLTSGGVTEELTLTVTARENKPKIYYSASADLVNRKRTAATLQAFEQALKSTVDTNEAVRYWNDLFMEPLARVINIGFGRTRVINSTNTEYVHTGVDYVAHVGDQVLATNAGKVVYVGEQVVSGKLVVIDHGYGLKSWYMHMSDISVAVGQTVEKGAVLGTVGNTGFTIGTNLHYELTVNGIPVNPYSLWDDGIKMYVGQ